MGRVSSGFEEVTVKKHIVLLLTAVIVAAVLSGCSPKNTETMDKAQSALDEGDFENAVLLYDAAIEEGKQLQACYRGKGIALMQKMEYQSAIEAFQTALESANFIEKHFYKDHMEQDIRKYLASCYIHNGQPGDAILIYNALIDKDDENVYLYMERGTAKAAQGDLESAKADFDKAINLDRGNYERILEIAQTLERYGGKKTGMGYLSGVSASDNSIDPVLKGRILYYMEDYKGADALLSQFAEEDEKAALIVCRCRIALGDTESAKAVIDSFGSKIDSSAELLGLLGSIYMRQEKYPEAAEVYERAVTAAKGTPELQTALFNRAVAYEYSGNFEKAKELFAEYLNQYSGDEEAKREMRFLKTR